MEAVMQDLNLTREELKGGLFKGTHGKSGKRFINANIGKNTLAGVGVEVASELCMRAPETFTGHCWQRSAGPNASNAGVNVATLMSMMGWSFPKTAMQFVKRSRITALQMSLYLANVQRANKCDPFPSKQRPSRKVQFSEGGSKTLSNLAEKMGSADRVVVKETVKDDIDAFESSVSTQALLADPIDEPDAAEVAVVGSVDHAVSYTDDSEMVAKTKVVVESVPSPVTTVTQDTYTSSVPVSVTSTSAVPVSATSVTSSSVNVRSVDPSLLNFLQNLQNHGTIQIHFNFGDAPK